MDSGFQSLTGFWISWAVFWIPQAKIFPGILHFTNKNFPDSFTWGDSIGKLRALLARILSFDFKILYVTKIMIKRKPRRKEGKRVIPLWNLIWKVFLKAQLRKRSWKKNEPFLLFGKKSFRHLYYQFQFQFQSVLFRLRLKTLWFKPPNENSFETVLNYLFHWLFNARSQDYPHKIL